MKAMLYIIIFVSGFVLGGWAIFKSLIDGKGKTTYLVPVIWMEQRMKEYQDKFDYGVICDLTPNWAMYKFVLKEWKEEVEKCRKQY